MVVLTWLNNIFRRGNKEEMFPFNSRDYLYNTRGYKILINRQLSVSKLSLEFQAEPSLYFADHRLLEELFIQPSDGPDYLSKRIIFTKMKTITELALNLGVIVRYSFNPVSSLYLIGSIGPMYSDTETERLAKGFAFSDIAALGTSVRINRFLFDIRTGIRHVSNADLRLPNSGHNTTTIDFGLSYYLNNLPAGD